MWGGLPPTCDMEEPLSALLALPVSPLPCICPSPAFPSPLLPLACPPPALRSSSLKGRGHFPELSSSPTGPSTQFLEASQSLVLGIHNPTWVEVGTGFSQSPAESWRAWCQAASAGGPLVLQKIPQTSFIVGGHALITPVLVTLKPALTHSSMNHWKQSKCLTMGERINKTSTHWTITQL